MRMENIQDVRQAIGETRIRLMHSSILPRGRVLGPDPSNGAYERSSALKLKYSLALMAILKVPFGVGLPQYPWFVGGFFSPKNLNKLTSFNLRKSQKGQQIA